MARPLTVRPEFYLRMATRERWSFPELQRQLNGAPFERTVLAPPKLSTPLAELHPEAGTVFKETYLLEFLELPPEHSEADLQRALVGKLQQFLIELGRDFCFVGSYYPLQVGGQNFEIDLPFFNRALNCLVAFALKIEEFEPAHLGQLEFYLEALDRDVRKPHERPSIGVLLCATKDHEVVEYASEPPPQRWWRSTRRACPIRGCCSPISTSFTNCPKPRPHGRPSKVRNHRRPQKHPSHGRARSHDPLVKADQKRRESVGLRSNRLDDALRWSYL